MRKRLLTVLCTTGVLTSLLIASAVAQEGEHKTMPMPKGKMAGSDSSSKSGKKMSEKEAMDKMSGMSADEKAAMLDKMPAKDKTAAMNMSGKTMSDHEAMDAMGKMSNQEKADMMDQMPKDKKMAAMNAGSGTQNNSKKKGKMGPMKMP